MATGPEQGTHFWHMSFLHPSALGAAVAERVGHWTPAPGMTRFDAMTEIRRRVIDASPDLAGAVMISFDIQLNQL